MTKRMEQADKVARLFTSAYELIVASPFLRPQATALHTTAFYPAATLETWPTHELIYLPTSALELHVPQARVS